MVARSAQAFILAASIVDINTVFPDKLRNQPCAEGYARLCSGKSSQWAENQLDFAGNSEEAVF